MPIFNTEYKSHTLSEEQTFTVPNLTSTGRTNTNIEVNGDIQELEFNATLVCPSSSSTWSDAYLGFDSTNTSNNPYYVGKGFQIGRNRSYYNEQCGGNAGYYGYEGTTTDLFYKRTPAATGTYSVNLKVNKTGMYCTCGTNYSEYLWTSEDLAKIETIFSNIKYAGMSTTAGQRINNTVKVTYIPN